MATEIYPVVHIKDFRQGAEQAETALEYGANGVYLIDHVSDNESNLIDTFNYLVAKNPNTYVGVNFLNLPSAAWAFTAQ